MGGRSSLCHTGSSLRLGLDADDGQVLDHSCVRSLYALGAGEFFSRAIEKCDQNI
jgi:hypothetical protein